MYFLDEAVLAAKSGNGGRGCVSFRRERFIPKGGPDGGDGGHGGNVILRCTGKLFTLEHYRSKRFFSARNGQPGQGRDRSGAKGADCILETPVGTIVSEAESNRVLADLVQDGQEMVLIPGGKGGKGNQHFATPTNRTPRTAQPGRPGETLQLKFTLKLLADIGLIGLPNAGKSTLLSRLTQARPKVAGYAFTTLAPNLGVLKLNDSRTLVVADIPGLVEGAHSGRGLGHQFLKHIERTRLLIHLLDAGDASETPILKDFQVLRKEMQAYDASLAQKPYFVVLNKIDLADGADNRVQSLQKTLQKKGVSSLCVSALTGEGIQDLMDFIARHPRLEGVSP